MIQQQVQYRFFIDSNTILHLRPLTTTISNTLEVNVINSSGDNNLEFQRNGVSYMTFNTDRVEINQELHLSNALIIDTADKLTMRPSLEGGVNIFDIRNLHPVVDNPMIRFRVGEGSGETIVCEMREEYISMARNVLMGTAYKLQTNTIDTNGDNDLVVKRNNDEFFTCKIFTEPDTTTYNLIDIPSGTRISAHHVYVGNIINRANGYDTVYTGSNATGDGRVDYMKWNYLSQSVDFDAPIDNTGISITGNIIDTTVSDERLKTNIEDVECNFTEFVKNVKVKTFEYTDKKI